MLKAYSVTMALVAASVSASAQADLEVLKRQVADTERAFARSMAERNHAAFTGYLSDQAVFFSGKKISSGKADVASAWKPLFDGEAAPFSWRPDQVEVTSDGLLALSTGLVYDPSGKPIARFNSVWRLEAPGTWRILFDKGQPLEESEKP